MKSLKYLQNNYDIINNDLLYIITRIKLILHWRYFLYYVTDCYLEAISHDSIILKILTIYILIE